MQQSCKCHEKQCLPTTRSEIEFWNLPENAGPQKSLCPSEVARELQRENWRPLMTDVRRVTALLVEDCLVVVTQFGKPVDPLDAKGHIRISLVQN